MGRKYEFTGKTLVLEYSKIKLRQIIRISDGLVGGWIQSENNLRNEGNCFVYDNAKVYGNARVYDNAEVCNKAEVYGNAEVCGHTKLYNKAKVCGNARVYGKAKVYGNAEVYGDTVVCDNAEVYNKAKVYDNAKVYDKAKVYGNAEVYGDARVEGDVGLSDNDILTNHCDHFTFREFDINVTDNHLKIGCERHKKEEWPLLLEGLIRKYDVKHPDVYRFFVNYYCKKWILS